MKGVPTAARVVRNEDINLHKKINVNGNESIASAVKTDTNGNIYLAGSAPNLLSNISGYDWWIKKISAGGTEDAAWEKRFDGNGGDDRVNAMAIDAQGNVFVAGYGTNLSAVNSGKDWWIKKIASDGTEDLSWNKRFDGNGKADVIQALVTDSNGNVYAAGYGNNLVTAGADWWVKKFTASGVEDAAWDKKISGIGSDSGVSSLVADTAGHIYAGGSGGQWRIKKFSDDGTEDLTWNKVLGYSVSARLSTLAVDANTNSVYAAGYKMGPGVYDWVIRKFSQNGVEDTANWDKTLRLGHGDAILSTIAIAGNGDVYLVGKGDEYPTIWRPYTWDTWLKKFSSNGIESLYGGSPTEATFGWKNLGGSPQAATVDNDGNLVVAGYGNGLTKPDQRNAAWLRKYYLQ